MKCIKYFCLGGLCIFCFALNSHAVETDEKDEEFCKAAETDAKAIAFSFVDYFAIPTHITFGTAPAVLSSAGGPPESGGVSDITFPALSGNNTAVIDGNFDDFSEINIRVSDGSGRCSKEYQDAHASWKNDDTGVHGGWNGAGVYTITLN